MSCSASGVGSSAAPQQRPRNSRTSHGGSGVGAKRVGERALLGGRKKKSGFVLLALLAFFGFSFWFQCIVFGVCFCFVFCFVFYFIAFFLRLLLLVPFVQNLLPRPPPCRSARGAPSPAWPGDCGPQRRTRRRFFGLKKSDVSVGL